MDRSQPGIDGTPSSSRVVALNRRRLMQAVGTLAVGTPIAGCVGGIGDGSGASLEERPTYSRWIGTEHLETATEERDGFLIVRTGLRELRELEGSDEAFGDLGEQMADQNTYQLAVAPFMGTVAFMFVASLGLIAYGDAARQILSSMGAGMGGPDPETGSASDARPRHRLDAGVIAGSLVVFEGDIDVDTFDGAVDAFEATEEYGDFRIYEGTDGGGSIVDTSELAFAVSGDAVLFPVPSSGMKERGEWRSLDASEILKSHIDVARGNAEEAADGNEDFDWTLRAGGRNPFVLGGHGLGGPDVDPTEADEGEGPNLDRIEPLIEDTRHVALSTTWDVERGAIIAEGGFSYTDESARPPESAFEDLVDGATTATVEVDSSRVRVEAEWSGAETGSPTPSG